MGCGHHEPAASPEALASHRRYGAPPVGDLSAADANGDGAPDLLVGLPSYRAHRGRVAVFLSESEFDGEPSYFISEPEPGAGPFGTALASAGDVDGDGFDDIVVGAPDVFCLDPTTGGARVYLYRGLPDRQPQPSSVVPAPPGVVEFGARFYGSGDVDGDGHSDVLVYAAGGWNGPCHDAIPAMPPPRSPPTMHLLRGSETGFSGDVAPTQLLRILGDRDGDGRADTQDEGVTNAYGDRAPVFQVGAGDIDNDGAIDLVAWDGRHLNVYAGSRRGAGTSRPVRMQPPKEPGSDGVTRSAAGFGVSLAIADFDGDGFADLAVGATESIHVYRGGASLLSPALRHVVAAPHPRRGFARAMVAADFNRDGFGDLAVADLGSASRRPRAPPWVFVYLGSPDGIAAEPRITIRLSDFGD